MRQQSCTGAPSSKASALQASVSNYKTCKALFNFSTFFSAIQVQYRTKKNFKIATCFFMRKKTYHVRCIYSHRAGCCGA